MISGMQSGAAKSQAQLIQACMSVTLTYARRDFPPSLRRSFSLSLSYLLVPFWSALEQAVLWSRLTWGDLSRDASNVFDSAAL